MKKVAVAFWLLVHTILSASFSPATAAEKAQLSIGDKLSVFSDKAYRKNNGRYFEAVGNVVIISNNDTIYGEVASLDQETMTVKIEGNVRVILKDMTLYGSHVTYNLALGSAVIKNARILTPEFNLVANELVRINENEYLAKEAEFSTCKDCKESWSVFGKTIRVRVGKYIQVQHGLAKIKGVNVIYVPYLVLPILTKRKTGLLFPRLSNRGREGLSLEQPVFWAIDESKDMTFSPTFWAQRGYGGDLQYRQRFQELAWTELNGRALNDTIYEPGKTGSSKSGEEFFRYFADIEAHKQWSPDVNSHLTYTGMRDLDVVRDHNQFTDPRTISSDFGFSGFTNWRKDHFNLSLEAQYLRNQLVADPLEFDRSYVQTLPRLSFNTTPYSVVQSKAPGFQNITTGVDGSFARFRQVNEEERVVENSIERTVLRNADRLSLQPYIQWHFFTWGPINVKTNYVFDQQIYHFADDSQPGFGKNAGIMRSEVSFTMDKIFGLAYEEKVPVKLISPRELEELRKSKTPGLTPIQKSEAPNRLVGDLPEFEPELTRDFITQMRNSYRHSQEYKAIHHYTINESEYGNKAFEQQVQTNRGWFDYEDAIRRREWENGGSITRTVIPPSNTIELQWNNSLIRKSPKLFSYLDDDKYLRDNFTYGKVGYFNISQGYILDEETSEFRDRLTRLMIDAGFSTGRWSIGASEYYFHTDNRNIFNLSATRSFDYMNIFSTYNYSSFENELNNLSLGAQVRPTDTIGVAVSKIYDLENNIDLATNYSLDIMPENNCWIFTLNYVKAQNVSRYFFNVQFNFGNETFQTYKTNYFAHKRI